MEVFTNMPGRTNFVDRLNTCVGFEDAADCCEKVGWFFLADQPTTVDLINPAIHWDAFRDEVAMPDKLSEYLFDPGYFAEGKFDNDRYKHEEGKFVTFRLLAKFEPDLFLTMFNLQNGYYSHGFECEVGGVMLHKGDL